MKSAFITPFMIRRLRFGKIIAMAGAAMVAVAVWQLPWRRVPPSVILISIDALRPDHLGAYGYSRDVSPSIDRFAEQGVLFADAVSQATWTLPSVASLFLSQYVSTHGTESLDTRMPDEARTLAEVLRDHGYDTAAFTIGAFTSRDYGMDQGFDHFVANGESAEKRNDEVLKWLRRGDRRFFAYVHYVDVHYPYGRKNPYRENFGAGYSGIVNGKQHPREIRDRLGPGDVQHLIDLYDNGISYADAEIGKLLSEIGRLPFGENTVLILTADHGEAFFEHRRMLGHRGIPYEELIRVPLILKGPRLPAGKKIAARVEQVDIAPTIFALCGIAQPPAAQGRSLLPLLDGEASHKPYTFSEFLPYQRRAIRGPRWKLIADYKDHQHELFDLQNDSAERRNRASDEPEVVAELLRELASFVAANQAKATATRAAVVPRSSTQDQLRALGYVE
ncbi:MAG: sulfatase [Candidatus Binatia bacterium]